ncbi:hypothetical protein BDN72DRAFT_960295, partial [Pluteus cervinus]
MSSTAQASIKKQISPLFQWLLNRPPIVREKRTYIIICTDPDTTPPPLLHQFCKVKFCFGLHEVKRFEKNCPMPARVIPTPGRHRPSFKRFDYPKETSWYAFTDPLPPGVHISDLHNHWHAMIRKFCKTNWRSEEETKKAVDELGKRFGGGLLVESSRDAFPFKNEVARPEAPEQRFYDIQLGTVPTSHPLGYSAVGSGAYTTPRPGKTMEELIFWELSKRDGNDDEGPTGWYRIYEDPNLRPGDATVRECVQMFMKLWDSTDLRDETQRIAVSEEIKELFRNHVVIRLPPKSVHDVEGEDKEA